MTEQFWDVEVTSGEHSMFRMASSREAALQAALDIAQRGPLAAAAGEIVVRITPPPSALAPPLHQDSVWYYPRGAC
jgi:hypothetical protein